MSEYDKRKKWDEQREMERLRKIPDEELSNEEFKMKHNLLTEADTKGGIHPSHC